MKPKNKRRKKKVNQVRDMLNAVKAARREEEIQLHGKQISRQQLIHSIKRKINDTSYSINEDE